MARRAFWGGVAAVTVAGLAPELVFSRFEEKIIETPTINHVHAGLLDVAYLEKGPSHGDPVVLLHGYPYDPHCYDAVSTLLASAGRRVITPWLRGYGPTRFLDSASPRVGQQAALGSDLQALLDALHIKRAVLAGYDWGGRAACVVAALHPDR